MIFINTSDSTNKEQAAHNHNRVHRLADKVLYVDYNPMHVAAIEALAFLPL